MSPLVPLTSLIMWTEMGPHQPNSFKATPIVSLQMLFCLKFKALNRFLSIRSTLEKSCFLTQPILAAGKTGWLTSKAGVKTLFSSRMGPAFWVMGTGLLGYSREWKHVISCFSRTYSIVQRFGGGVSSSWNQSKRGKQRTHSQQLKFSRCISAPLRAHNWGMNQGPGGTHITINI